LRQRNTVQHSESKGRVVLYNLYVKKQFASNGLPSWAYVASIQEILRNSSSMSFWASVCGFWTWTFSKSPI